MRLYPACLLTLIPGFISWDYTRLICWKCPRFIIPGTIPGLSIETIPGFISWDITGLPVCGAIPGFYLVRLPQAYLLTQSPCCISWGFPRLYFMNKTTPGFIVWYYCKFYRLKLLQALSHGTFFMRLPQVSSHEITPGYIAWDDPWLQDMKLPQYYRLRLHQAFDETTRGCIA